MVFNSLLMLFLVLFGFIIYIILLGNPVEDISLFLLCLVGL